MSRTDDHAPWWVQAQDQLWQPVHLCERTHRPCDLPDSPPRNHSEARPRPRTLCWWTPTDWHKIKWSRYSEWYLDTERNRSRAKRQWRKEWDV